MKNDKRFDLALTRRGLIASAAALGMALALRPLAAHAAGGMVALVHTQAAGDNGPIDAMISRLNEVAAELGAEARAVYASDPATYGTIFRTLGDAGAAVIVSTFNEVGEAFKTLAPEYPNTKWIQLFGDPIEPPMANVVTVAYDYYLGCYLAGMFGALMSKTGKIGYVGGMSLPPLNADANALKAGALAVNPQAQVSIAFAGSFQDPVKGQQIANEMYKSGVDYIQVDAGGTDAGVIAAANENPGTMVGGLSPAQYDLGPATVANLVSLDFGRSLFNEVTRAMADGWTGGHIATKLGDGVIDMILSPVFLEKAPADLAAKAKEVWPQIEAAKAQILDGSLVVPLNTEL